MVVAVIGVIILLGVFLMHFSKRTGWPLTLVLLVIGLFIGPVFHLVNVNEFQTMIQSFAIIALIVVLFDTGYEIKLSKIKQSIFESTGLALIGVVSTIGVVFLVGKYLLGFDTYLSILFGALLASTDLTVIVPMMQNMKLKENVKEALDIEATLNSVFAAVIAIVIGTMIVYNTTFSSQVYIYLPC